MRLRALLAAFVFASVTAGAESNAELKRQVRATEIAFARSIADRNFAAFQSFLSGEAIFFSGGKVLRGAQQISEGWKRYFEGAQAPFSWEPEQVEVLDSGSLAMSSGPIRDPSGKRVGTFNSVWRREPGGEWKIVLDNGCPPCRCPGR